MKTLKKLLFFVYEQQKEYAMATESKDNMKEDSANLGSLLKKKNETLTREELLKKLKYTEELLNAKDRTIRGQNFTIQTLTAQNLAMRDLLEQIKNFTPGFFNGGKWTKIKDSIISMLDRVRGR